MKKECVVVSGIGGFVGHHLARELTVNNTSVIGVGRDADLPSPLREIVDSYHSVDITKSWPEINNMKAVIHLAGLAAVGPSFDNPQEYIHVNSSMITNLCEYYLKQEEKPRIIIVSSGAIYDPNQPMPIPEEGKISLMSPYTISKVLVENQAAYYRNRGLDCIVVRPFNHIGPGQGMGFILPDFYSRLSSLGEGEKVIKVGNIKTRRDYTDVRDIVRAYRQLALTENLKHSTYNVCSGISLSGIDILNRIKTAMHLSEIDLKVDEHLVRPTDVMEIRGDSSRIQVELGWKPEYSIDRTVSDFITSQTSCL